LNDKLIEVINLSKSYKDVDALKDVTFDVYKGTCCGLLGTNGAGKSTLIKILIGQISSDIGDVLVNGLSSKGDSKKIHRDIGVVPDNQALYEDLTVWQNIDIFRRLYGLEIENVDRVINLLKINDKKRVKVKKLSKGLKQRVLIARAIIHNPSLLILDEPTIGLDPSSSENIYKVLNQIKNNGVTILMTTHQMNDVERLCDYIVFLNKGRVIDQGSIKDLRDRYGNNEFKVSYCEKDIGKSITFNETSSFKSFVQNMDSDCELISVDKKVITLEEVFIKATEG
jgi:ABC-2 type transport system ATP-binding protein